MRSHFLYDSVFTEVFWTSRADNYTETGEIITEKKRDFWAEHH